MPLEDAENRYTLQILQAIAEGDRVTQRSLSSELGVALGLTNLLIRRLVGKGYLKMAGMGTRHVRYLMTAAGWEALGHAARNSLENTVRLYTETREQIRESLAQVARGCEADRKGRKCVVFYGAGDVAEIAYVSLQKTDLTLLAVIDDFRRGYFFGLPILAPDELSSDLAQLESVHFVVTTFRHRQAIRRKLQTRGISLARVSFLESRLLAAPHGPSVRVRFGEQS